MQSFHYNSVLKQAPAPQNQQRTFTVNEAHLNLLDQTNQMRLDFNLTDPERQIMIIQDLFKENEKIKKKQSFIPQLLYSMKYKL